MAVSRCIGLLRTLRAVPLPERAAPRASPCARTRWPPCMGRGRWRRPAPPAVQPRALAAPRPLSPPGQTPGGRLRVGLLRAASQTPPATDASAPPTPAAPPPIAPPSRAADTPAIGSPRTTAGSARSASTHTAAAPVAARRPPRTSRAWCARRSSAPSPPACEAPCSPRRAEPARGLDPRGTARSPSPARGTDNPSASVPRRAEPSSDRPEDCRSAAPHAHTRVAKLVRPRVLPRRRPGAGSAWGLPRRRSES
jgi:hypothetical protein